MGQAAPRVVEEAQEGCAFRLQTAMQAARSEAELLGDMFGAEASLLKAAGHRLANSVQRMVGGFLPLDLLLAVALDELEELRIGVRHGKSERGGRKRDRVDRLVEEDATSKMPFVFGDVGGLPMHQADRDRAPAASGRGPDPRHETHQDEVGHLDDVRHGDGIGKFDAARAAGDLHEFEMVGGEHGLKAREIAQAGLEVGRIGHEVAERVGGKASPRSVLQAEKAVAGNPRGQRESVYQTLKRHPGEVVSVVGGSPASSKIGR
jgi:hypothetical protein